MLRIMMVVAVAMFFAVQIGSAGENLANSSNAPSFDYHLTILNLADEPVDLVFWGASGSGNYWEPSTNPVKLFTGSSAARASASFDPCYATGGGKNVDITMGAARHGLDTFPSESSLNWSSEVLINQVNSAFNETEGRVLVQTMWGPATTKLGFSLQEPEYYSSHPYGFMQEYYGNLSDLFAVVLSNDDASKHFIWAGKTLHHRKNGEGSQVWARTCRAIFYSYYYEYAYSDFLFVPKGGWYVNTGGGSDDLLWAMLAGIGYMELSSQNNNGMGKYIKRLTESSWFNADSNAALTDTYLNPTEMQNVLNYLYPSGYYYAGIETPDQWYGIPWKDHLGGYDYRSSMTNQKTKKDYDGFNQRASISNGLFWLYAARLLKNKELFELSGQDVAVCRAAIDREYDLFFGAHKDLYICQSNTLPNPAGRKIDRVGLIEDGAHYPCQAYTKDPKLNPPKWEKQKSESNPDDYFTWTYNTGVALAALGESYLANPSPENARKFLVDSGIPLANAALNLLSWQKQDSETAPKGVICEIETEMRGFHISNSTISNSIIIFKGLFAIFIGDYAEALYEAIIDEHLSGDDLAKAKTCYKRISGALRGTSNFLWDEWGVAPISAWVKKDSALAKDRHREDAIDAIHTQDAITEGSAAAHITAGRLAHWDRDLVMSGYIDNPDEYLVYTQKK